MPSSGNTGNKPLPSCWECFPSVHKAEVKVGLPPAKGDSPGTQSVAAQGAKSMKPGWPSSLLACAHSPGHLTPLWRLKHGKPGPLPPALVLQAPGAWRVDPQAAVQQMLSVAGGWGVPLPMLAIGKPHTIIQKNIPEPGAFSELSATQGSEGKQENRLP